MTRGSGDEERRTRGLAASSATAARASEVRAGGTYAYDDAPPLPSVDATPAIDAAASVASAPLKRGERLLSTHKTRCIRGEISVSGSNHARARDECRVIAA